MPTEFISDKEIYDRVIQEMVIEADRYVWIATADIKDLYVKRAYTGSANLAGEGMGVKGVHRRNFESGILTNDPVMVNSIMNQFGQVWVGRHCELCRRKQYCPDGPLEY